MGEKKMNAFRYSLLLASSISFSGNIYFLFGNGS
jgi:hypothetical protein